MTEEKAQDARAIANYLLDEALKRNITDITPMKLLKLVFLAHGWSYAFATVPLVRQQPQAWQYGPVYPEIYDAIRKYGSAIVTGRIENKETGLPYEADLSAGQKDVVDKVLRTYGKRAAFELSNITHQPNSPWSRAIDSAGVYGVIPAEIMKTYYQNLAQERGLADK
ncbi:MAG: DUF4065 domain-containing protein [Candidatus Tokpelaia sp.]|uniref:Panacea domain-containing protein n=1 Tax=Candidatus Tokpelaia sp. TaxID=2233777 RepID=UPI0012399C00|nr:type II toxin-antitoxin system antitoxin SocA domain-containing protein [Candidatus Tokpelaia sp.]KAA6206042.1 MAG: DUF4065 domain-containing protein [Candidatus Tokpelaia sp.]KAA6206173.1 MAG: DUF4065 domain-containing protein [Candidatus Tokpelaia sp.]KAA6406070.1 hypothetical protein DPQ22_01110 [Candidatus Tokpelaia sp.]